MTRHSVKEADSTLIFTVKSILNQLYDKHVPELKFDMPVARAFRTQIYKNNEILIGIFNFEDNPIHICGSIRLEEAQNILNIIQGNRRYNDIKNLPGMGDYFDWNKTIIVLDIIDESIEWEEIEGDIVDWLNDMALPRAERYNDTRVKLAIPNPPQYSFEKIQKSLWVIENEEEFTQGTAFDLDGVGIVTNQHVVSGSGSLVAFRSDDTAKKFNVRILRQNQALDLAIIELEGCADFKPLKKTSNDKQNLMDHVLVCGFANYRYGDSGIFSPGIIVGTRQKSGVQRLLTNAGIVAGMSGGPAVGEENTVTGVCVTGSDFMQEGRNNEDQSIIPISALDVLTA